VPYSTQYSKERHGFVEACVTKVNALKEGRVLSFPLSSQAEARKFAWLLHDYLHLIGASSLYTVRRINETILLGKLTKPRLSNVVSTGSSGDFSSQFDALMRELLSSSSPDEIICRLARSKEISKGTLSMLLAEYSRIMES